MFGIRMFFTEAFSIQRKGDLQLNTLTNKSCMVSFRCNSELFYKLKYFSNLNDENISSIIRRILISEFNHQKGS